MNSVTPVPLAMVWEAKVMAIGQCQSGEIAIRWIAGEKYGPMGSKQLIRARILELVYYIQMIQER